MVGCRLPILRVASVPVSLAFAVIATLAQSPAPDVSVAPLTRKN